MNDFYEDIIVPILLIASILAALIFVIVIISVGIDYLDCRGFQKGTGIETRYEWGCYANVDGKWIPKAYAFGKVNEFRIKKLK